MSEAKLWAAKPAAQHSSVIAKRKASFAERHRTEPSDSPQDDPDGMKILAGEEP